MSASGTGPFENDYAMDLCDEIRGAESDEALSLLGEALSLVAEVEPGEYLERDLAEAAVAAAAIIAARSGASDESLEKMELKGLIPRIPEALLRLALSILPRTLADDSEVYGLWIDVDRGDEWRGHVERLLRELDSVLESGAY
ncbi:DUF4259 domain-containing protein [Kitasatospora sp. NPDC059722]|uniref:DUF4259 domain-containing protein n=1 Tax=unclassified Kitasatospora TaxID=2633591 RepID=UPI0036786527